MGLTPRRRLLWFAVTAFVALFGVGEFAQWVFIDPAGGSGWWGIDLQLVIDAGGRFATGQPIYSDPKFLYPPLVAILAQPLAQLDFMVVSITYAGLKIAIAIAAVASVARELSRGQQVAAALMLVLSLPFLHDVMLGNANVLLVGAMVPAMLGRDRTRNGVLLGLTTAAFAKPLVVPVLLWLLAWRRRTLLGTVLTGLAATAATALVAGPGTYLDWARALLGGTRFAVPFAGNHGVTALVPALWLPVAAVMTVGLLLVLARRSERTGITWAVTAGILIAPYAGTYSALPVALAAPGLLKTAPNFTLAMVALSTVATGFALPFYAAAILGAALVVGQRTTWTGGSGSRMSRFTARAAHVRRQSPPASGSLSDRRSILWNESSGGRPAGRQVSRCTLEAQWTCGASRMPVVDSGASPVPATICASPWVIGLNRPRSATRPASGESVASQIVGMASVAATRTVQRRSVRAPQATSASAPTSRIGSGIGKCSPSGSTPTIERRATTHWPQSAGARAHETALSAAVAPSAMASDRHSLLTANQTRPTPGVTFVSRTNDHAAGQRNPTTTAAPMRRLTLPAESSIATGYSAAKASAQRPDT
jgi:hypothetical protein